MIIGRHVPPMPPASCVDTPSTRQPSATPAAPIAAIRGIPLRRASGDGPAFCPHARVPAAAPSARALSPARVRQKSHPSEQRRQSHTPMGIKTCLRQPLLDDRRRELEYYLNRRLFFADSHRLWPQAFRSFRGGIRQEASDQNTLDIALEIAQGIKRLGLLEGLDCRDVIHDDLHYRRYGADSPFQLAQLLQKRDLINGILTLGPPRALSGRLVNAPDLQALNVIVFADHLYLLDAPRCHYQHLSLPCDPQALTMALDGFLPETGQPPAPCFRLHHIGFF